MVEELPFLQEDIDRNRAIVVIMTIFPVLFFLPLIVCKESRYGMFFANQTLLVFIASAICGAVPFVGWIAGIVVVIFHILNIIHAVQAVPEKVPLFGQYVLIHYENLA